MSVSKIRWAEIGRGTIGCQLLYRVEQSAQCAIREAIEEIELHGTMSGPDRRDGSENRNTAILLN
jgi:hypothetical protein